ncbi:MAG: hypothetical protein LJE65_17455 [Desulfobacteraceae bacterium]|nr:hypothetical protein [Desulfobacteraceae bacterium]
MKSFVAWAGVLVLILCVSAASAEEVESLADGFADIHWGAGPQTVSGLSKLYSKGGVDYYARPGQMHAIGDFEVTRVVYGFYQGQFFASYMELENPEVFADIRRTLKQRYGDAETSFSTKENLIVHKWKFKDVKIKLKSYDEADRMKLGFYYTPISNKVNEEKMESDNDKALELFPIRKGETPNALPVLRF